MAYIKQIPSGMAPMTPKLTVLLPESFFFYMKGLTVLDLSYTGIERVPESVCDLENMRALLVGDCGPLSS
ncbi:putative disease resistance RPP13-like protein 1 [Bienertia sinuspersici]